MKRVEIFNPVNGDNLDTILVDPVYDENDGIDTEAIHYEVTRWCDAHGWDIEEIDYDY